MSFDINEAYNPVMIDIEIDGWKPLKIKYGFFKISEQVYVIWQVLNTSHTFGVPINFMYSHHNGVFKDHFMETLKKFREDLLEWRSEGLPEEWMKKYNYEFYGLLL